MMSNLCDDATINLRMICGSVWERPREEALGQTASDRAGGGEIPR